MYFGNGAGWRSEASSTSRVNHGIIVLGRLWSEVNGGADIREPSFAGVIVAFAQGSTRGLLRNIVPYVRLSISAQVGIERRQEKGNVG
jgi:hypothetical protein